MKLAVSAAIPPTKPPMKAVNKINKKAEPAKGKTAATFEASKLLLEEFMQIEMMSQRRNMPRKPVRKALPED
jgi:hypothetical protein